MIPIGQYHRLFALDRKEFINPHAVGDGLKLWEQIGIGGVATALHALVAVSNGRGGGDFRSSMSEEFVGRWGGERIAVIGDYAEPDDLPGDLNAKHIYHAARIQTEKDLEDIGETEAERKEFMGDYEVGEWTDISELAVSWLSEELGFDYVGDGWVRRSPKPGSIFEDTSGTEGLLAPDMIIG